MKYIIGKKREMTQIFTENGDVVPVTKVQAGPCVVTQVKTIEKDGYAAVQIGYGKKRKASKAQVGHLKSTGLFAVLKEVRTSEVDLKVGDKISVGTFSQGDAVSAQGVSKGKGFQGVVKRHGFAGMPASHGTKDQVRMPGSIGAKGPAHVFKGTRMGGRMGNDLVTVKGLEIVQVDSENNILYIKGALPGARNGIIVISGDGKLVLHSDIEVSQADTQAVVSEDRMVEETSSTSEEVTN